MFDALRQFAQRPHAPAILGVAVCLSALWSGHAVTAIARSMPLIDEEASKTLLIFGPGNVFERSATPALGETLVLIGAG